MKHIGGCLIILFLTAVSCLADVVFVEKVIDAQTLKLLNGETVKLIGLDMESLNLGDEEKEKIDHFVRGFISGTLVELEYDTQKTDEEGNLLAYVWFEYPLNLERDMMPYPKAGYEMTYVEDSTGLGHFLVFLNATMIKSGFAKPIIDEPNVKHAELFDQIYKESLEHQDDQLADMRISILRAQK